MKITKDEARILSIILADAKYDLAEKKHIENLFDALTDLENRLEESGKDKRRYGRRTLNDFSDCLKRIAKKNKK